MRIAIVSEVFLPAVDGVVTRLRHTLEGLVEMGDEVVLIAPAGGPESYAGARVIGLPGLPMPLYPDGAGYPEKRVALPQPALWRALRAFRPDVIHAINPMLIAAGGVACARGLRVPLVASYHANIPAYARYYGMPWLEPIAWRYIRALHRLAELNLCTSQATRELLERHGVPRLALWLYGVSDELRRARPPARQWRERLSGGRPERKILLFVGRLAKEKEVGLLRSAVADVEGTSLAIVGDGPLRRELEAEFAGTATRFLGILTGEDLANAYAAADLFVFPSRSETLGMVMLEARCAGLPIVAADSPAARELVAEEVNGLRFDASSPRDLVAAVRRLTADPDLLGAMSQRAGRGLEGATWRDATVGLRAMYAAVSRQSQSARPSRLPTPRGAGRSGTPKASRLVSETAARAVPSARHGPARRRTPAVRAPSQRAG